MSNESNEMEMKRFGWDRKDKNQPGDICLLICIFEQKDSLTLKSFIRTVLIQPLSLELEKEEEEKEEGKEEE